MKFTKAAFLKLAALGAVVFLPTRNGKFLFQEEEDKTLRPPGGHHEKSDQSLFRTIWRELKEEFNIPAKEVKKKLVFLGYEYRKPYHGNAVFELKGHGLKAKTYQASNSPDEKIKLVEATLDHPKYVGPDPSKLLSEEAKKKKDQLLKAAAGKFRCPENFETIPDLFSRAMHKLVPVWAGANDWESTWSAATVKSNDVEDGKSIWVWVHLNIPEEYANGAEKKSDWGRKVVRRWIQKARDLEGSQFKGVSSKSLLAAAKEIGADIKDYGIEERETHGKGALLEKSASGDMLAYKAWQAEFADQLAQLKAEQEQKFGKVHAHTYGSCGHNFETCGAECHTSQELQADFPCYECWSFGETKAASIAVDLDGTLAKGTGEDFDPKVIGEPVAAMLKRVKQWLGEGKEVIIFTARAGEAKNIPPIRAWLDKHGLQRIKKITNEKSPAIDVYYDDRTIGVVTDTGKLKSSSYVKINLTDTNGQALLHHYLDADKWDYPAGRMEDGEEPLAAAVRELMERTGYQIDPAALNYGGVADGFHTFAGSLEKAQLVGKPQTETAIRKQAAEQEQSDSKLVNSGRFITEDELRAYGKKATEEATDFNCRAYSSFIKANPEYAYPAFREFVEKRNRADRDSGELDDISKKEIDRLVDEWPTYCKIEGINPDGLEQHDNEIFRPKAMAKKAALLAVPAKRLDGLPNANGAPATADRGPLTGPEAIAHALGRIDINQKEREAHDVIRRRLKSKRPDAVKILGYIQGMRRAEITPKDFIISRVPVIPPQFRPFSMIGETFVPGDANELYRDLINVRDSHGELEKRLGPAAAAANRLHVYDAVGALYGFKDPVSPKTLERGVSGFLSKLTGSSPKFSFVQRKLLSKDTDYTGRSVAGVDPDLGLDEIGIPDSMAWTLYAPYIQRRLVRAGMGPADAVRHIRDKSPAASKMLDLELADRPVMYSRAPSWHKFNTIGGYAKRVQGNTIMTNPLITTGQNLDYDGDSGRFYLRIHKDLASSGQHGQVPGMPIKKSELRVNESLIHIQNFPRLEETGVRKSETVMEYAVPPGTSVYALNRETLGHEWMPVSHFSVHENLDMWSVALTSDRTIFVSADHSLVVYRDGKLELTTPAEATGLCVPRIKKFARHCLPTEHVVATGEKGRLAASMEFKVKLNYEIGLWLGLIIGDGCVNCNDAVYLYGTGDKAVNRKRFAEIAASALLPYTGHCGELEFTTPSLGGGESLRQRSALYNTGWFNRWLKDQIGSGALEKRIPDFSLNASVEHMWGILDGLISTDGSVSVSRGKKKPQLMVNFSTSSHDLVAGLQVLLEHLGVRGGVNAYKSQTSGRDAFIVTLSTVDLAKRDKERPIAFNHPGKNATFREWIGTVSLGGTGNAGDQVPFPRHLDTVFKQAFAQRHGFRKDNRGKTDFGSFTTFKSNGRWDRAIALRELDILKAENIWTESLEAYFQLVSDASITWEKVISTRKLDDRCTGWDITVPGSFTFALDDGTIVQDTLNVHVPSMPDAVDDVKNKLMPSKMLFSIKDPSKVVPTPKQETVLGLYDAQRRPARASHTFPDEASALTAIKRGDIKMSDEIQILPP